MSYCEITISGQKIGLKFGLPASLMLVEKVKKFPQLANADGTVNGGIYGFVLYFGYINNCMLKDVQPVLEADAFMDFLEDIENEETKKEIENALLVWAQSRQTKEMIKVADGIKKKNGTTIAASHIVSES